MPPCFARRCAVLRASLCFLFAVTILGCGSTSTIGVNTIVAADGFPHHSVTQILDRLPDFPSELVRASLEIHIAVSAPQQKGRFKAVIDYSMPDSLIARIRFPLGIEGARVLIIRDSAYVYDRIEKTVYQSTTSRMSSILPGSIIGPDMARQALGFLRPDRDRAWRVSADSLRYYLHSDDGLLRYSIDPGVWRIVQLQLRDETGTIVEQRWYMDFKRLNNLLVPRRMVVTRPEEDTRIAMALRKIDFSPGNIDFDLDVSSSVRWVFLEE